MAHLNPTPIHQGKQVFDGMSRELDKNHGYRMCEADFEGTAFSHSLQRAFDAMRSAQTPGQPYADVHAWTFTPESFRLLMIELQLLGLTRLVPTCVSPLYGNQFCAVLERAGKELATMAPDAIQRLEHERFALSRRLRV